MPELQHHSQSTNGDQAERAQAHEKPQDVIRVYLDEHGPARVPFRYLLVTWGLTDADPKLRGQMGTALAEAGINVDRPLLDLAPGDEIELSSTGVERELNAAEALRALDGARAHYSSKFEQASAALADAEQRYLEEVTRRWGQLAQACRNRLVVSIGRRRVLRLHETALCCDNAEFVLTHDVVARVEPGEGIADLEVKSPGWRLVERFDIGTDVGSVQELSLFAGLVNAGVGRLSSTKDGMAERTMRALVELGPAIDGREEVELAARRVAAAADATGALDHARLTLAAALDSAPRRQLRVVRRARRSLTAARETIEQAQRAAAESAARVARDSARAGTVSRRLELPDDLPALELVS